MIDDSLFKVNHSIVIFLKKKNVLWKPFLRKNF